MTKELGPIARAMADKKRKCYEFDVAGFMGLSGPMPKLAIRCARVSEQDRAVDQARDYVKKLTQDEEVRKDVDILENAKTAHVLAMACRDAARPDELPAFPSGAWLLDNTTADQLGTLLNLYNSVRAKESPAPLTLEDDRLEALIAMCSLAHNTEIPDAALAQFPREYLTQALILLSVKLMDMRSAVEARAREADELRALLDAIRLERNPGDDEDQNADAPKNRVEGQAGGDEGAAAEQATDDDDRPPSP